MKSFKCGIALISCIVPTMLFSCGKNEKAIEENNLAGQETLENLDNSSTVSNEEESFKIDWQKYENQMDEEEKEDFQEYITVLNDENTFYCFNWLDKDICFSEYLESIESEEQPEIAGVALVDLDNQNGKELVIHFFEGGGNYLILTRDDGKFYGTNMGERLFEELQNDGKYLGSGGAGDLYFYRMSIDSDGVIENKIGELHGIENEDGSVTDELEIDGKVTHNGQEWVDENYSDPVNWIE
ncbi:hypothetical protein CSX00_01465 [Pseudobutyrivibrio ruminis]|uniref:Uncharacterized protein n=1 Tax=Pseudobutyrivibrio ruminis TaxID=46206 RepID=A0A2G3ED79_9FIRM|nr:hypothetical protein [Pseudobutyrivibrio ruminis]PHU41288.1 hypothetical protein CSX00_01465 [Pseudobutyrivibrio ruminis]